MQIPEPTKIIVQQDEKIELTLNWESGIEEWEHAFRVILKWMTFGGETIDDMFGHKEHSEEPLNEPNEPMDTQELTKISNEVSKVIEDSKAIFFVNNKNVEISAEDTLNELKETISNDVGMYFYKLINQKDE